MFTTLVKECLTKHLVKPRLFSSSSTVFNSNNVEGKDMDLKSCVTKEDVQRLDELFPTIVTDLIDTVKHSNMPVINNWYTRLLEYTVPNGKPRWALSTILTYKLLEDPQKLTPENIRLANILGWCIEIILATIQVSDDILDQAEFRWGKPCWHMLEDVKMSAVNDVSVLENSTYIILRKYLRQHPAYMSLVELCHEIKLKSGFGQTLDYRTGLSGNGTLESFTIDRYRTIAQYKTEYIAFQFPVAAGMYLAGIDDVSLHDEIKSITQPIGYLAQVKNDMQDCFGYSDTHSATLYNDIRDGKCTWPALMTLQRASPAQRTAMEQCYGRPDDQSVQTVLDIYKALDMPKLYANHEAEIIKKIHNNINQINPRIPKQVFYNIVEML